MQSHENGVAFACMAEASMFKHRVRTGVQSCNRAALVSISDTSINCNALQTHTLCSDFLLESYRLLLIFVVCVQKCGFTVSEAASAFKATICQIVIAGEKEQLPRVLQPGPQPWHSRTLFPFVETELVQRPYSPARTSIKEGLLWSDPLQHLPVQSQQDSHRRQRLLVTTGLDNMSKIY